MGYYVAGIAYGNDLYHHGIKGQKWGIRRYQNADGTLTAEGKARYGTVENFNRQYNSGGKSSNSSSASSSSGKSKMKTALKIGAVVAGTALLAYGGYKLHGALKDSKFSSTSNRGENAIHDMFKDNLRDLGSNLGTSKAKGAESELRRMSSQLHNSIPKPSAAPRASSIPKPSSIPRPSSTPKPSSNSTFNAKDALKRQYDRMSDRSDSRNANDAFKELERLNEQLKRNRRR